jgi:ATP-dependent RNA helicase DeaD
MSEETLNSETANGDKNQNSTQASNSNVTRHTYIEVGNDLLAKPDALIATLTIKGTPASLVFCNSPSEADMVEVMLKKKGITASKLIGNIPFQRVAQELQRIQNKEISALVITDIAAREIDINNFEIVVNYGIPEDPEIYLHRITGYENANNLKEVLSLVSPLDFGNFHYLKKVAALAFDKIDLPSAADLGKAQIDNIINKALNGEHLTDEAVQAMLPSILNNENRDKIVAMLLYNTLKNVAKTQDSSDNRDSRGGNRSDRNRDDRWNDDRRGGRNDRRGGQRSEEGEYNNDRRSRSDRNDNERYDNGPIARDARLYIGQGAQHGVSAESLNELVKSAGLESDSVLKRITLRDYYTFVDVAEEGADDFIAKLQAVNGPDGNALLVKKATFINCAKEKADNSEESTNTDVEVTEDNSSEAEYAEDQA